MRRVYLLFLSFLLLNLIPGQQATIVVAQAGQGTDGTLDVIEVLPADGAMEIGGQAVVTVVFNRPVVPLGTLTSMEDLPNPLQIEPAVAGEGSWLNTSIYTFEPQPGWAPGTTYTITVEDGLTAVDGAALTAPFRWSFTTTPPQIVEVVPEPGTGSLRLDPMIQVRLNVPLDRASLENNFYMRPLDQAEGTVSGTFDWNEETTGFAFEPDDLLQLNTTYEVGWPAGVVLDATSTAALPAQSWTYATVPPPRVVGTNPGAGEMDVSPFGGITIFFASPMNAETLQDRVVIQPEPWREPEIFYQDYDDSLFLSFPVEPSTDYSITLQPGAEDIYGNTITEPFSFGFVTAPYGPEVRLEVPGPVGFYNAVREETRVFVTHRNVDRLDLNLFSVPLAEFARRVTDENVYDPTEQYMPPPDQLLRSWQIESVAPLNARRYELLSLGEFGTSTVECPGAPPPRVAVGDTAIVVTDPDPLRARSEPPSGEVVAQLYRDYVIPVVGGPVCANDILWWQVRLRDDQLVWVAEGLGDEYFIDQRVAGQTSEVVIPQNASEGDALAPGIYYLQINAPQTDMQGFSPARHFMVVATANLTMKTTTERVAVWATDVETGEAIANAPIQIYDSAFNVIAEGVTGPDGLLQVDVPNIDNLYVPRLALLQSETEFGVGLSTWAEGIDPWRFGVPSEFYPQAYRLYMYTDRPIYRPDQPVHFRGVLRQKDDINYTLAGLETVPVQIFDDRNEIIYEQSLPLTDFGTFSDTFELAEDAPLGFYRISVDLPTEREFRSEGGSVFFNVAEFRLPEFQVELEAVEQEVVQGETIRVELDSRYFFGGAVADADVTYNVINRPYNFEYDGPGRYSFEDRDADGGPGMFFEPSNGPIASGEVVTDEQGSAVIEVEADLQNSTQSQVFVVEAVVTDESDQAVAGRTEVVVHKGLLYVGVSPQEYVATANRETTVDLIAVDWGSEPISGQQIEVQVVERRWSSVQEMDETGRTTWTYEVEEIPVSDGEVTTDAEGRVQYTFTPPNGGIFKIIATTRDDQGNDIRSAATLWASGENYVAWRQQNSNRIDLVTDATTYAVGDTAEILIPSPFQGSTEALVTVERGDVLYVDRITLDSNSGVYELPITADFAPNAYVSVFVVKGVDETNPVAGFRMGLTEINVDDSRYELTVEIEPDTEQAGPRETVTYTVRTLDDEGQPVSAEVGVGLTDLASLSVADPNSVPLMDFFYGPQALSVRTGSPLTINTDQITQEVLDTIKGGGGGFGEGGIFDIREDFIDTAYWNGSLVTGEDGTATFEVTLPDNLTTWRLDARAVTRGADDATMLVGQETFDLLSTKPLLIRPVTPRFFVVGDEVVLAAIVNNNTGSAQSVEIGLESDGITLQDDAVKTADIPAGGRQRIDWRVTVDDAAAVDLTFFARSEDDEFTDASKPPLGQGDARLLPVYRYEAPEITGTGGLLREAGEITEGITLPSEFDVTQGELTVSIEPSLAATSLEALEVLRTLDNTNIEVTVSRFLPNIMTVRALDEAGLQDEALSNSLSTEVQLAIQRLYAQQKPDGGWGWYVQDDSNPLVTAYALIGLQEAQQYGFAVDPNVINRAVQYLQSQLIAPDLSVENWRLDRQAVILYALAAANSGDVARTTTLYDSRGRLSIYAQALLARTLHVLNPGDARIDTLVSDLVNAAIISANGAHWEEGTRDFRNWNTNTRTTAIVLGTLVELRPQSELLPNIVRWLMVARSSEAWETTQETAWAVMALTDWMVASGELQPSYDYAVAFNGEQLAEGAATPSTVTETRELVVDIMTMLQDEVNTLTFARSDGSGNLYYTAYLRAFLPVPEIDPVNEGIIIQRRYVLPDGDELETIDAARVGDLVQVRLTIIAPNDLHYVVVEDPIPAGTDAVNPDLATAQQIGTRPGLESVDPVSVGWGWWWFSNIEFRDEKVVLNATYLPAGTYEYVYTIRPGLAGTYNVIPATGREYYFPEVFGRSAGSVFTILPADS